MSKTYTPQQGSIAWNVIEFLTTNPEEELTASDIEAKFDKPAKNAHSFLSEAVRCGVLKREANADDELAYKLGSGMPQITPKHARHPSLRADVLLSGGEIGRAIPNRGVRAPFIDTTKVTVRDNVPLPDKSGRPVSNWGPLLDRMKPGQSCVLPMACRSAVAKHAANLRADGKGQYALRKVSDTECGLWRIK